MSSRTPTTPSSVPTSAQGQTTIADSVVSTIAGIAARQTSGVHALGGGAARAVGALRERIPGATTDHSRGVSVELGPTQAAVDIALVVEHGVAIPDLASGVRRNVIASVERMTGLRVTEVTIDVDDVVVPAEVDGGTAPAATGRAR